jgi:hypothetical protein
VSDQQLFQLTIRASGEVRDADGNLISSEPIEAHTILTLDQVRALENGDESWLSE